MWNPGLKRAENKFLPPEFHGWNNDCNDAWQPEEKPAGKIKKTQVV